MFKSNFLILILLVLVSCGGKTTSENKVSIPNDESTQVQPVTLTSSGFEMTGTHPTLVMTNPSPTADFGSIVKGSGISTYTFPIVNNVYGNTISKSGVAVVDVAGISAPYSIKCYQGTTELSTTELSCAAITLKKGASAQIRVSLDSSVAEQVVPDQVFKVNGFSVTLKSTIGAPVAVKNFTMSTTAIDFNAVDPSKGATATQVLNVQAKAYKPKSVVVNMLPSNLAVGPIGTKGFKVVSNTCPTPPTTTNKTCSIGIAFENAQAELGSVYSETINVDSTDVVLTATTINQASSRLIPLAGTSDVIELGTLFLDEPMPTLNDLKFRLNTTGSTTETVTGIASSHTGLSATQACTTPVSKNVYCSAPIALVRANLVVGSFSAQVTLTSAQGVSKPAIINAFFQETRSTAIDCSAVSPSVPAKLLAGVNTTNAYTYITNNLSPAACVIKTCVAGFEPNATKTACQATTPVACSLPSNIAPLNNSNGKIATVDTTKDLGSCEILTCVAGYQPAADAKSCVVIPVVKCSLPTNIAPLNNSNGKIATVDTTKDLGSCEILTCSSGYVKSQDEKSCEVDMSIERSLTVNKKLGGVISSVPTATASFSNQLRLMDVGESVIKKDVAFPQADSSVIMNVADSMVAANGGSVLFLQYPSDVGNVSPGYELEQVSINSAAPVSFSSVKTGSGLKFSVTQGANLVIDLLYGVKCSDAGTVASIRQSGLITTEVATYKKNVAGTACIIDTCNATFTKSSDELNCESNAPLVVKNNITVIRGSEAKDQKCAVTITGQPLVNDATMAIEDGPQSTTNAIDETGNATVTLGSCAEGYSAILKEVVSTTDMTATAMSSTYCINGVCSIPMNQARFVKVEVTKTLYPFNALAILREDGADEEVDSTYLSLDRSTVNAGIGDSITNNAGVISRTIYTSSECLAYAGKIGAISLAVDPRCSGGLTKGSRNAIANRSQVNLQEVYEFKSWEMPAQGLVYATGTNPSLGATVIATPSTVSNTYKAIFGPKTDTITSDVDYYSKTALHAIFPLQSDMIELYIRAFDVNLNNYISNVTVQVLNSSQQDVTSRFTATCMNTNTLATVGPLTLTDNISQCINDRTTSKYLRLVFKYDTVNYNGETDPSLRAIIEDESRTGSYTVNYFVTSKNIDSQNVMGTRLISYPIKINANNDIRPPMTISDATTDALVPEVLLPSNGIPRSYNSWGSGIDYEIGQSTRRYNSSTGATLADTTMYRNMDYNYTYPSISEKMAKISFNKAYMPASSLGLAYNIKIRIQDRLNNCSFINDRTDESNIDGDHIAAISGIGTKTTLGNVTNPLFVKYQFNGQHSTASRVLLNSSDVATSALSSGCVGTAVPTSLGSAIEANGSNLSPEITEKYDFIGNDNWVCEAGEVCYVNDLSQTTSAGVTPTAKISMKSYVVRMRLISEDMEKTDAFQMVKVEKPDASVVSVANATFDVVPMVDNRMDPTNDGLAYGFSFDASKLDFIDYKSPGNSSFKVGIANATSLCGSGSPCTYKFIRYANRSDDKGLNSTGSAMGFPDLGSYRFNDEPVSAGAYSSVNNAVLSFTGVGGSNTFVGSTLTSPVTGTDLHNHNMEVLAIIKKDNVTYKKMINMASMHRIHEQPVMYAIKSIYSGGSLTGMKFIYDLNRYDEQGNAKAWTEDNPTVGDFRVSEATYPQTVRQNFYPENHISFTTGMGARRYTNGYVQVGGELSPATTSQTNYSPTEANSGFIFPISGSNLNFWKLARVNYADGPSLQVNGEPDNFHTYLNFKQCAEATPYYYYGQSGWACYSDVQAVSDGWK